MSEHTSDDRTPIEVPPRGPDPTSSARKWPVPAAAAVGRKTTGDAERALVDFGPMLGWGLLTIGLLVGWSRAIATLDGEPATLAAWTRAAADATAIALAFGLAGRASAIACLLGASHIAERSERGARSAGDPSQPIDRAIGAPERLAEVIERRPVPLAPAHPPDHGRAIALAEVEEAVRTSRPDHARALLDRFEARYPGDPSASALGERLDAIRRQEAEGRVAQIEAARKVNDPGRVLELYGELGSSSAFEHRSELEQDLARWFLDLIHRRLRGGRIQPDVVQLAARAAETFATTVEGASLRASLPVLRRSVGLCPRCAQPYVGPDAACPQCQMGAAGAPGPAPPFPPSGPESAP